MTDHNTAGRVLEYAKRLNMLDGHFVWLWIDTSGNLNYKNITDDLISKDTIEKDLRIERSVEYKALYKRDTRMDHWPRNDISDMQFNSLLKDDHFLLFNTNNNRRNSVESSKFRSRRDTLIFDSTDFVNNKSGEKVILPQGLLNLRPLPIRVDRHLVKGAVRLLVAALEMALARCPIWLADSLQRSQLVTSCWKPLGPAEHNFSIIAARYVL